MTDIDKRATDRARALVMLDKLCEDFRDDKVRSFVVGTFSADGQQQRLLHIERDDKAPLIKLLQTVSDEAIERWNKEGGRPTLLPMPRAKRKKA